jgi:Zn-dependent protease
MNGFQTFMSLGVPAGRIAGIRIRIHVLFIAYVVYQIWALSGEGLVFGLSFTAGLYLCILLHEFGHALSARWCGGEADEILIWPLGGLAYCRPPFSPTPHLITTLGGPFVTLVLWGVLSVVAWWLRPEMHHPAFETHWWWWSYIQTLATANGYLLLFNAIPAFPLDGGRALRDTLWHFMPIQKANRIAGVVGIMACIGIIGWGVSTANQWMVFIGIYAIFGGAREMIGQEYTELWQVESWSLRARLARSPDKKKARLAQPRRTDKKSGGSRYQPKLVPRLEVRDDRRAVEKVDAILEKISRCGMDSLTPEERRELERASSELKRQDR